MIRWSVRAVKSFTCPRPTQRCHLVLYQPRWHAFSTASARHEAKHQKDTSRGHRRYAIFDRVAKPKDDRHAWLALLDGALPPHLRDWSNSNDSPVLSAVDVAEILLSAQYPQTAGVQAHDLLYHLGFNLGRWNAVVWLVRSLVERFPIRKSLHYNPSHVNAVWNSVPSLESFTGNSTDRSLQADSLSSPPLELRSLEELTAPDSSERHLAALGHHALGQVWRTLGEMTKSSAGGEIRPEVLEIIAYLHHREVMPMSIYQSEPHLNGTAVQQPPLLSILSSRILTSLSDAAWRAHEKLIVEEAKATGAEYAALRPEVPGSIYRVHVAGLRPELWMELILWSCLRGGWTVAGSEILRSIIEDRQWKPISWQEYEKSMPAENQSSAPEWVHWEHAYKTRASSRMDAPRGPVMEIARTVSAEVVNAYIDALPNHIELGIGSRGTVAIEDLIQVLQEFKAFLRDPHGLLDISFSTWDALVTRLLESQTIVPERDTAELLRLVTLSAGFALRARAVNNRDQPGYVGDGNLAMQGLLQRALYGQITAGSLEGALEVYWRIQGRADADKQRSLRSFLSRQIMHKIDRYSMFTSNYSGIEYPAFGVKISTPVLGSFLELVTDAKQWEFGRWLLDNDQLDGPLIGPNLYRDPFIQPAVIRFAIMSNDRNLLTKIKEQSLLRDSFRAVFDTQVDASEWRAATRVLEYLAESPGRKWSIQNLTKVAHAMLIAMSKAARGDEKSQTSLDEAQKIFYDMVRGKYNGERSKINVQKDAAILNMLSILSVIDSAWADFCARLRGKKRHHRFVLQAKNFNLMLRGIVAAYGSATGRRILETFWPRSSHNAYDAALRIGRNLSSRLRAPRARPMVLESIARQRIAIRIPAKNDADSEVVMYGALTPNVSTIMIILRAALDELQERPPLDKDSTISTKTHGTNSRDAASAGEQDASTREIIEWAVRQLAELPYVEGSIIAQLEKTLSERGMKDLCLELPTILEVIEGDLLREVDGEIEWKRLYVEEHEKQ